jgi:ankyrin repeat protein
MGRRKLARILLEAGPDLKALNQQKETSLDIAKRKDHSEIAQLIQNPPPLRKPDYVMMWLILN